MFVQHHAALTLVLLMCRRTDGIAVVAADEDSGCAQDRCKVEGCMCIAFAAGTFAKERYCHVVALAYTKGH